MGVVSKCLFCSKVQTLHTLRCDFGISTYAQIPFSIQFIRHEEGTESTSLLLTYMCF